MPVPGATVTATQTGKALIALTDPRGTYSFPDLPDGQWTIQVEMLCFETIRQEVNVTPGSPPSVWDLKLLPLSQIQAAAGPSLTVPLPRPEPALTTALPKPARGKKGVNAPPASAQPGFKRADLNASASKTPASNAQEPPAPASEAFASQNPDQLNQRASDGFLINGSSNNAANSPFSMSNAFGNSRRGGRSLYNGGFGLILDNSALDARAFSLTGQNTAKPAYTHIQGIASIGGPLKIPRFIRNGPIFFVGYQWIHNPTASTLTGLVPTDAERTGDLSHTLNLLGKPVQFVNPGDGLPFTNNVIPPNRIVDQARALLNLYPTANFDAGARYNFQTPVLARMNQNNFQSRATKSIGVKEQITGSFAFQGTTTETPNLFGFVDGGSTFGFNTGAGWTHRFNQRVFLHFAYQFSRSSTTVTPNFANKRNVSADAGIVGNNQDATNWGPPALLFSSGIAALSDAQYSVTHNQTSAFTFDGYWSRSPHNFTYGMDFRRQQFNTISQQDPRGKFTFTGAATGSDLAGFLLGIPDVTSLAAGNADKYFRSNSWDAFLNDDWRVGPGLTVNAGVRWEYSSPISELYGRLVNLDVAPGFASVSPVIASSPRSFPSSLVRPDKIGFQPRLAFSWRPLPASSMVVRGGYGIYYNTSIYQTIAAQMAQQPPLSKTFSVQNSLANPLTLANGFNAPPGAILNTFGIDPDFRVGFTHNWQLSVQRDLRGGMVMTVTYLGIKGTRAVQQFLPNTFPSGAVNPCPSCPSGFTYMTSNGNSTREAGQLQLRRRLRNGFTASLDYTYSKSIDDAALGGKGQGTAVIAQNWLDLNAERGLSLFDQRHLLALQGQYTTGMGIGGGTLLSGWRGTLLKEWTFVSQINAGTGLPLTPTVLSAVRGTGVTGTIRPDYTGASLYSAPAGSFLNPAAYALPVSAWGNAGRNSITGPAQFTLNASVGRTFRLTDRFNLDLRIDSTNALNHVTFPSWNTIVNSSQFGLPNAANPMRSLQTTLRVRF